MNVLIDWKLFVQMEREELFILLIHALWPEVTLGVLLRNFRCVDVAGG